MQLLIDAPSGQRGSVQQWVEAFAQRWREGRRREADFLHLMHPEIVLRAPGLKSTRGVAAGHEAFRLTFAALPDLTGEVHHWALGADGATTMLFIEMSFHATVGGRRTTWRNVDRFRFVDGAAVERQAYFDPTRLRLALLRHPCGWRQLWALRRLR